MQEVIKTRDEKDEDDSHNPYMHYEVFVVLNFYMNSRPPKFRLLRDHSIVKL